MRWLRQRADRGRPGQAVAMPVLLACQRAKEAVHPLRWGWRDHPVRRGFADDLWLPRMQGGTMREIGELMGWFVWTVRAIWGAVDIIARLIMLVS